MSMTAKQATKYYVKEVNNDDDRVGGDHIITQTVVMIIIVMAVQTMAMTGKKMVLVLMTVK